MKDYIKEECIKCRKLNLVCTGKTLEECAELLETVINPKDIVSKITKLLTNKNIRKDAIEILSKYFGNAQVQGFMFPVPGINIFTKEYTYVLHPLSFMNLDSVKYKVSDHVIDYSEITDDEKEWWKERSTKEYI